MASLRTCIAALLLVAVVVLCQFDNRVAAKTAEDPALQPCLEKAGVTSNLMPQTKNCRGRALESADMLRKCANLPNMDVATKAAACFKK